MFKFLVDHNVPKSVSIFLRKKNYNVLLVKDINPEMTDVDVIQLAIKEKRIILSNDKDFLLLSLKYPKVDIILFNFKIQEANIRITSLKKIIPQIRIPFGIIALQ